MSSYLRYLSASVRVSLRVTTSFRSNFILEILLVAVRVSVLVALWNALYLGKTEVNGIDRPTMILYSVVSIIFGILISSAVETSISDKIASGDISIMMTRPVSYPVSLFFEQLAFTVSNIVSKVLPYTVLLLISGLWLQAQVHIGVWFMLSTVLSYGLMFFYQMFFGLIAFWTIEADGFSEARTVAMQVFSGATIPLWFFPDWLYGIAKFLPFQAIFSTPLSVLIGRISGPDIVQAVFIQLVWLAAFAALTVLVWNQAKRRVIVNGG